MTELILYHLRVFHTVAKLLNYSRAGEELALSQPAVSRQISALEKGLGLDLFSQHGRRVVLTDAGRALYDYADRIMTLAQQAGQTMGQYHDLERGKVRLGVSPVVGCYLLPPLLKEFQHRFPNISFSLQLADIRQLTNWVTGGELDMALASGTVESDTVFLERYTRNDLVLVSPPDETASDLKMLLLKYPLIIKEKNTLTRFIIDEHLSKAGLVPKSYLEISDTEVIKKFVISGIGIAFLPWRGIETESEANRLKIVSGEKATIIRWVHIITSKDQHYNPALLAFMNFIRKYQDM